MRKKKIQSLKIRRKFAKKWSVEFDKFKKLHKKGKKLGLLRKRITLKTR